MKIIHDLSYAKKYYCVIWVLCLSFIVMKVPNLYNFNTSSDGLFPVRLSHSNFSNTLCHKRTSFVIPKCLSLFVRERRGEKPSTCSSNNESVYRASLIFFIYFSLLSGLPRVHGLSICEIQILCSLSCVPKTTSSYPYVVIVSSKGKANIVLFLTAKFVVLKAL